MPVAALGHTVVIDAAVKATCTETGLTAGIHCTVCDEILVAQKTVDALGHTETVDEAVAPTCTETGLTAGTHCTVCDEILADQEIVDALGHTEAVDEAVAPTCTETGLTAGTHCTVCDEILTAQETVDALGHNYGEWKTVKNATCTENGEKQKVCTTCGDVVKATIKATGHTYKKDADGLWIYTTVENPTCIETGRSDVNCTVCGETKFSMITAATGHTIIVDAAVAATCTEDGLTTGMHCAVCDTVLVAQETVPATGHAYVDMKNVETTCTVDGVHEVVCENCGDHQKTENSATGHAFNNYKTVTTATCEHPGEEKAVCDNGCGAVDVRTIAQLDHSLEQKTGTIATCTESGYTAGLYCSDCEKWISGHEVIPATNHANAVADAGKAATCTESGFTAGRFCVACDKWIEGHEVIDAIGHQYGEEQYKAPTAEADGGTYEVCSECGNIHWIQTQTYKEYVKAGVNATTLKATATGSIKTETITVKWTNSSDFGITYYKVYRSTTGKDGSFSKVAEVTTKSYVDKKATVGKTYYYKVIGYREVAGSTYKTKTSNIVSAKIKKVTAAQVKETPMYGRTNYVNKGLKVMWTSPNIKVDGYEIFRSTTGKAGSYKLVKTTKTTVRSWTNTGLKVGKRYYYKVRGYKLVNGKKVYTKFSSPGYRYVLAGRDAELASAIVRANAITAKSAVKVNNGIKVTWSKDANIKCNKYEVWRATSKNGTYTKIATTKNKYYTDKNAKAGKTYYYKIKGFRVFGKSRAETNYSNVVSGKR